MHVCICSTFLPFLSNTYTCTINHVVPFLPFSHTLCDLAHICAEVCCNVDSLVNKELMGAFRALCLPMTMMKSCMTGFSHLTSKSNVSRTITLSPMSTGLISCPGQALVLAWESEVWYGNAVLICKSFYFSRFCWTLVSNRS